MPASQHCCLTYVPQTNPVLHATGTHFPVPSDSCPSGQRHCSFLPQGTHSALSVPPFWQEFPALQSESVTHSYDLHPFAVGNVPVGQGLSQLSLEVHATHSQVFVPSKE